MTNSARVRWWIAAALLVIGVTVPVAHRHWLKTRIFEPFDRPITLSKGQISTGDFYINLPETYWAEIAVDYTFTYAVTNPPCTVYTSESVMKFRWKLFRNGEYLGEDAGGSSYVFGRFDADKPGLYRIDLEMLSDPTCANAGHPRIRIHTWSGEYEDRQLILSWISFFLVLGAFGLTAHTAIFSIRDHKLTSESAASVLEPQDVRLTPPLHRLQPLQRIVGLPAFGTVMPMFLLCMLVIFMINEMDRPIPKGHWAFLTKHPPVPLNSVPPLTIYLGYGKGTQPEISLNDKQVSREQLDTALKQELKTRADWIVYIDANPDLPFADIASIVDSVHRMHAQAVLITSRDGSIPFDAKRCRPEVEKSPPLPKTRGIQVREWEKPTGDTPLISYEILESGETGNTSVKRSSGYWEIDQMAVEWVHNMRYNRRPGCGAIDSEIAVSIHWHPAV